EHDRHGDGREVETSGNGSLVGGNQAVLGLDVPVNVSGNAVGAVLGSAGAAAEDTGALVHHGDEHGGDGYDEGYDERSAQSSPVGGGLIDQLSEAARPLHLQTGGLDAGPVLHQSDQRAHQSGSEGDTVESSSNGSILGGNQLVADANVPVNVAGNAIAAVGGNAGAAAEDAGAIVHEHDTETVETSGNGSIIGGNQAVVDADVPVNVAGNAVGAVLGNAGAAAEESGAAVIEHDRHGDGREVETSGNGSLVGGNQAVLGLDVPV